MNEPYKYIFIEGKIYDSSSESIATALSRENNGLLQNDSLILYGSKPSKVKSLISDKPLIIPNIATRDNVIFLKESDKDKFPEYFI